MCSSFGNCTFIELRKVHPTKIYDIVTLMLPQPLPETHEYRLLAHSWSGPKLSDILDRLFSCRKGGLVVRFKKDLRVLFGESSEDGFLF
ncbi:hypothetical protein PsAD46_03428 [Pseudovibrio sp. Ad46]|nr:hypothetical protein PsAD46_03428 [Pseudovibrio sp. Ad46]